MTDDDRHLSAVPDPGDDVPDEYRLTPEDQAALEADMATHEDRPFDDPKLQNYMDNLEQWQLRLYRRIRTLLRLVELDAPEVIIQNQERIVNQAALHMAALTYTITQPARTRLEELFEARMKEVDPDA